MEPLGRSSIRRFRERATKACVSWGVPGDVKREIRACTRNIVNLFSEEENIVRVLRNDCRVHKRVRFRCQVRLRNSGIHPTDLDVRDVARREPGERAGSFERGPRFFAEEENKRKNESFVREERKRRAQRRSGITSGRSNIGVKEEIRAINLRCVRWLSDRGTEYEIKLPTHPKNKKRTTGADHFRPFASIHRYRDC